MGGLLNGSQVGDELSRLLQDGSDGYGCDWHPSLARHEKVAATLSAALKSKLGW